MTDDDLLLLIGQLQRHEGIKLMPYLDPVGKVTIGVGRNLDDVGISEDEADYLLANDIQRARDQLRVSFAWYDALDSVRQSALVNLCFNLGIGRLLGFHHALAAMAKKDYANAADEFFDSKWARQVGNRAVEICAQIRSGTWES